MKCIEIFVEDFWFPCKFVRGTIEHSIYLVWVKKVIRCRSGVYLPLLSLSESISICTCKILFQILMEQSFCLFLPWNYMIRSSLRLVIEFLNILLYILDNFTFFFLIFSIKLTNYFFSYAIDKSLSKANKKYFIWDKLKGG